MRSWASSPLRFGRLVLHSFFTRTINIVNFQTLPRRTSVEDQSALMVGGDWKAALVFFGKNSKAKPVSSRGSERNTGFY